MRPAHKLPFPLRLTSRGNLLSLASCLLILLVACLTSRFRSRRTPPRWIWCAGLLALPFRPYLLMSILICRKCLQQRALLTPVFSPGLSLRSSWLLVVMSYCRSLRVCASKSTGRPSRCWLQTVTGWLSRKSPGIPAPPTLRLLLWCRLRSSMKPRAR